jgi:hypothetical protein
MTPKQRAAKARKALYAFENVLNTIGEIDRDKYGVEMSFSPAWKLWQSHAPFVRWVHALEEEARPDDGG